MLKETETAFSFFIGDEIQIQQYEAELRLTETDGTDISFELSTEGYSARYQLQLFDQDGIKHYKFVSEATRTITIQRGRRRILLETFFYEHPPIVWFADGSSLEGNLHTELKHLIHPYPVASIQIWDWAGVVLRKESQTATKEVDSIQYRVIQILEQEEYQIIYDDDDAGEAADVVAIRVEAKQIVIDLFHCKYAHGERPGARLADLYEVCGQAQKSVRWAEQPTNEILRHLLRREQRRGGRITRFERGTEQAVQQLLHMSSSVPVRLRINIVQPGLSKQAVILQL